MEILRGMSLPPGFGFHPTDAELISHYLKKKMLGHRIDYEVIPELDIYKHEPWDLPAKCNIPTKDSKWHFFTCRDRKYPNGSRSNRATEAGYWKSTGKDRNIKLNSRTIGTKKTLVFHEGRPPGKRTDWIMHEYYLDEKECKARPTMKDVFVLCRVTKRNGWTPEGDSSQVEDINSHPQWPNGVSGSVSNADPVSPEDINSQPQQPNGVSGSVSNADPASPEDINSQLLQPNGATGSVPNAEPATPIPNGEELQAWLEELFDPAFEVPAQQNAQSSALSLVAPKLEIEDSGPNQNMADDTDYLLADDIYNILYPGTDDFSSSILQHQGVGAASLAFPSGAYYTMPSEDRFTLPSNFVDENQNIAQEYMKKNETNLMNGQNDDTGIILQRRRKTATFGAPLTHRIKLQVGINKMVMGHAESINQTMKFVDNGGHLDLIANVEDQKKPTRDVSSSDPINSHQASASHVKKSPSPSLWKYHNSASKCEKPLSRGSASSSGSPGLCVLLEDTSCIQGFLRALLMLLKDCSSAGLNFLLIGACMVGTVAVMLYFLLRDGRRFLSAFSSLGL